jgi:hypothetical protein
MAFDLTRLNQVDFGKAHVAFQKCLETVVRDCLDRPGDKSVRKVSLDMEVKPVMAQDGDVMECEVAFKVQTKLPAYQTAGRPYAADRGGRLIFNPDAPENPEQTTIMDADEG